MITTDRISLLETNRDEIVTLTNPYYDKIAAGLPLTIEEQDRLANLIKMYGEVSDDIDACWKSMVKRRKTLIKKFLRK